MIEIETFCLAAAADEAGFLAADRRMQREVVPNQPGFMRRTTARGDGDGGGWIVITLWDSNEAADAALQATVDHEARRAFMGLIDDETYVVSRYQTLD